MSRDGVIGYRGAMPWKLPRDLKRFRELTLNKPVIMGRKTYQSIGRPLPGRTNIVLSRRIESQCSVWHTANNRDQAIELAVAIGGSEAMIIGGAQVYELFLPLCSRIYATIVEGDVQGDTYFPAKILDSPGWKVTCGKTWKADDRNSHDSIDLILTPSSSQELI